MLNIEQGMLNDDMNALAQMEPVSFLWSATQQKDKGESWKKLQKITQKLLISLCKII